MHKIAIVGAGQAGLELALGLIEAGQQVTLVSNRTADQIGAGRVLTSQCMFNTALQHERDHGLNSWEQETPKLLGLSVTVGDGEGGEAIDWTVPMEHYAQSTDQRLKMSGWLKTYVERGGRLVIREAGVEDLEELAADHDLVIVASGKGAIGRLFARDAGRSPFDRPMRALAMIYVTGMLRRNDFDSVSINIAPGVGEYVTFPALTTSGRCDIMTLEAIPGGPLDLWPKPLAPEDHLEQAIRMVETFFPWEAWRCADLAPTDTNCTLAGRFAPVVRKPVATLPSGATVLGLADTVCLNDPIAGQGSNNAARGAEIYLRRILDHAEGARFDVDWMEETFADYWRYAEWATALSNALLVAPEPHVLDILTAAQTDARVAGAVARGFDMPSEFSPWFFEPAAARAFLDSCARETAQS